MQSATSLLDMDSGLALNSLKVKNEEIGFASGLYLDKISLLYRRGEGKVRVLTRERGGGV